MGKTLLVVGAGPGIGLETASRFAREGFDIVLASRQPEKLGAGLDELQAEGAVVETRAVDAADGEAVSALVGEYAGTLDVLLYNAAVLRFGPTIDQITPQSIDEDIQVGLSSALRAIQAALPGMAAKGGGTILLTGGGIADTPYPVALTLGAVKSGLRNATQALFEPLKAQNVHLAVLTVNASVTPGSDAAREIADAYWELHASAPENWAYESHYPKA